MGYSVNDCRCFQQMIVENVLISLRIYKTMMTNFSKYSDAKPHSADTGTSYSEVHFHFTFDKAH